MGLRDVLHQEIAEILVEQTQFCECSIWVGKSPRSSSTDVSHMSSHVYPLDRTNIVTALSIDVDFLHILLLSLHSVSSLAFAPLMLAQIKLLANLTKTEGTPNLATPG